MAWTTATTRASGYTVTAAVWNAEHVDNMNFLKEVGYTQFTASVTVNATTEAAAVTVASLGAITYEAVPHLVEIFAPYQEMGNAAAGSIIHTLWDGATDWGRFGRGTITSAGASNRLPCYYARRFTPTAASHTFIWKAWRGAADGLIAAGTGGGPSGLGLEMPGFIRVTRIPT